MGQRKDLEVYSLAIRTSMGETFDWQEETPKEFVLYVERSSPHYWDGTGREGQPVSFNYDRWLGGSVA